MDRQLDLLTWIKKEHNDDLPLTTKQIFERYSEEKNYSKSKANLSEILSKLRERGLLESPAYGSYDLSDRGRNKAESVLNPEEFEGEKPEGFEELVNEFKFFFEDYKESEVYQALNTGQLYKLQLSELEKYLPELVDELEERPETVLEALSEAAESVGDGNLTLDYRIIFDVPYFDQEIYKARSAKNTGSIVVVEGTVSYSTSPAQEVVSAIFECSDCGDKYEKDQDSSSEIKSPYKCDCGSRSFERVETLYQDVIELNLSNTQEENHRIKAVLRPESLDSDVKKAFRPGNRLRIGGLVKNQSRGKKSRKADPYMDIVSYENLDKRFDPEEVDEDLKEQVEEKVRSFDAEGIHPFYKFSSSIAPNIQGQEKDNIREVVAASIIGGYHPEKDNRVHSLIIGNPGEGKSDILEWCKDTFSKFLVADGTNSTGVGLTGTVEQEESGGYRLKAGKLVYADKGILGIDEIQGLDEGQLDPLRKAMQQGYFTLDKATEHAELPGRATVIATGNYTEELGSDQFSFLKDHMPNLGDDGAIEDRFALKYCIQPGEDRDAAREAIKNQFVDAEEGSEAEFDREELAVYSYLAKDVEPSVTGQAGEFIEKWVDGQEVIAEQKNNISFKNTSARFFINLFKLASMFARSRLSETVERRDAEEACRLFYKCQESQGLSDGETGGMAKEVTA